MKFQRVLINLCKVFPLFITILSSSSSSFHGCQVVQKASCCFLQKFGNTHSEVCIKRLGFVLYDQAVSLK